MRTPLLLAVAACWLGLIGPAGAQFKEDTPPSAKPGEITTQRWRIGMIITAEGSAFNKIVGTTTVVMDWPDQQIRPIEEDLSPGVTIESAKLRGRGPADGGQGRIPGGERRGQGDPHL